MRRIVARVLDRLYAFDSVRTAKARLRPIKHFAFGKSDIYYVADVIRAARGAARPVRVVFDIGAAIGDKTLTFLQYFPEATVYAFEPQTASREHFIRRTARWKHRVVVLDYALSNTNGQARLRLYSYRDASSLLPIQHFSRVDGKREIGVEDVAVRRLDDCVRDLGVPGVDLLKIDVEGLEREVLQGGVEALRITSNVFVEISPMRRGPHSDAHIDVFRLLHEAGFTLMGQFGDYWFSKDPDVLRVHFGDT